MRQRVLEMYSGKDGVVAVKNPVKLRILHVIGESGRSFEEIVSSAGRAKATVSVHLADLKREGLVREKGFDGDRRKKVFCLAGHHIGAAKPPARSVAPFLKTEIAGSIGDPLAFMASLFRTMRFSLEARGFDAGPAIKEAGREVGIEIAKTFSATTLEELRVELPVFWSTHRLGRMSFAKMEPPTIRVCECVSTKNSPNMGKTACALSEGLLESVFSACLKRKCSVRETKCHSTGHPYCELLVTFCK